MENIYNTYSFENHPIIQTLKLRTPTIKATDDVPFDLLMYCGKEELDEESLIKIYNDLCSKVSLKKALQKTKLELVFNVLCLNRIITKKENSLLTEYYILHSAIAYCATVEKKFDTDNFLSLLKAINTIRSSHNLEIAGNMLSYIVYFVTPYFSKFDFEILLDQIRIFSNISEKLPSTVCSSLIYSIYVLGSSGFIDENTEKICQFLGEKETTTHDVITETSAAFLFDRIFEGLVALSVSCLTFLLSFVEKLPWCVAERFFNNIGFYFAYFIHQNDKQYLKKIVPSINKRLTNASYTPAFTEAFQNFVDDTKLLNIKQKNLSRSLMSSSVSLGNFKSLALDEDEVLELINQQPANPAVIRNIHISFKKLKDAETIDIEHAAPMIVQAFHDISPYDEKQNLVCKYNDEELFEIPENFTDLENRIAFVTKISKFYPKARKGLIDSFLSILNEHFDYDIAYSLILFLSRFESLPKLEKIDFIIEKIFDPRISLFNDNKDFLPFMQMRVVALELLTKMEDFSLETFAKKYFKYPTLTAEIFYYLELFIRNGKLPNEYADDLCQIYITFLTIYTNVFYSGNTSTASTIQHIIDLFFESLKNECFGESFMANEFSISFLVAVLFDEHVCDKALELSIPIWQKTNLRKLIQASSITIAVFDSSEERNKEKAIILLTKILKAMIYVIRENPSMSSEGGLLALKVQICFVITKIGNSETNLKLVISVLNFLTVIENMEVLNEKEISELTQCLLMIKRDDDEELYNATRSLIIGSVKKENPEQSYITCPLYLTLFYTIYGEKTLSFLHQLIDYSQFNRLQCHLGNLDLLLLEKWEKTSTTINEEEISLFIKIAEVASSMQVIHKIISMLCADNEQKLSPNYKTYLDIITAILKSKSRNPVCSFPLCNNSDQIEIKGFRHFEEIGPVSLLIWVNIDNGTHNSNLMKIVNDELVLDIAFIKKELNFTLTNTETKTTIKYSADLNIIPNRWDLLTIEFDTNKTEVFFNQQHRIFEYGLDIRECEFCVIGQQGKLIRHPVYIGPFSFAHTLTLDQISEQCEIGPHLHSYKNCIAAVGMEMENNLVTLESEKDDSMKVTLSNPKIPAVLNFSDILIRYFTAQAMVPVFHQLHYHSKDDETIVETTINLFVTLFSVSRRSEGVFIEGRCWKLVAFLLSQCSQKLTYQNYLQFYLIFKQSVNAGFKNEMLKTVLINPTIWIKGDEETIENVSTHWHKTLIPSADPTQFLFFFNVFFGELWTKESPKVLRDNAIDTLIEIAAKQFTVQDFIAMMNFITNTDDKSIIIAILNIIQGLCLQPSKPMNNVKYQWPVLGKIFLLFEKNIDEVSLEIINTIDALVEGNVFRPQQYTVHCELANIFIGGKPHSKEFILALTKMAEKKPELLILVSSILAQNTDLVKPFIEYDLCPDVKYITTKSWTFWLLATAIQCENEEYMRTIFKFVLNCTNNYWDIAFMTILILTNNEDNARIFLTEAATKVRIMPRFFNDNQISNLMNSCAFFLFYRRAPHENEYLYYLMNREVHKKEEEKISLIEKIKEGKERKEFVYGLSFDAKTGEWKDTQLAMMLLEILSCIHNQEFNDFGALLASFLLTQKPEETKKIIPIFLSQHKPSAQVLQLLTSHMKAAGSTLVISPHRDVTALDAIPNALEAFSHTRKFYIREMVKIADCASRFRAKGIKKIAKYSKVTLTKLPFNINRTKANLDTFKANITNFWNEFWSTLTSKHAPWDNSKTGAHEVSTSSNFEPMKVENDFNESKEEEEQDISDEKQETDSSDSSSEEEEDSSDNSAHQ